VARRPAIVLTQKCKSIGENSSMAEILLKLNYAPIDTNRGIKVFVVAICIAVALSRLRQGQT
jgi:hypothetical protein